MSDRRSFEELKDIGAGLAAPDDIVRLYRQAFREFGVQALWDRRPSQRPTIAQALAVADRLRREGNLKTLPLAARIEAACRAAL